MQLWQHVHVGARDGLPYDILGALSLREWWAALGAGLKPSMRTKLMNRGL